MRVSSKLISERNNLVKINYMFSGFKTFNLFLNNMQSLNGIKITMKPPPHPCRIGMHISTSLKEYEHFVVK